MGRISLQPIKQELELIPNPLAEHLKVKIKKRPIKNAIDQDGNPITIEVEDFKAIKLFKAKSTKDAILQIKSSPTLRLYLLIIYNIQEKEDYIRLNPTLITKKLQISKSALRNAIKELSSLNFIAKSTTQDYYWINPQIFFFGSRKNKYPNNTHVCF